jgi:uncharacterized protein (DUF1684 family)
MDTQSLLEQRRMKDEIFAGHHSPLDPDDAAGFRGLDYYKPNPDLIFRLTLEPTERARIRVQTSDGKEAIHERAGVARLEVEGHEVELVLYDTGHPGYFLPFRDKTSGAETYGAGRYLDIEPNDDGTVTIDFNLAYNPLCAYSDAFSCPLPPVENWLTVPIEAGERDYRQ